MGLYYGKHGEPITMEDFGRLHADMAYRRIDSTTLPNVWVSTVWLGLDHGFRREAPIIFETMVFRRTDLDRLAEVVLGSSLGEELDCQRYATIQEAEAGHDAMVAKWRDWNGVDRQDD